MQQTRLQCRSIKTARERETQKSLQARNAASHVSDEKRKGWLLLVTVMIEIVKLISN